MDRDPPHVTYVRNPTMDFAQLGTSADHAYWLSGIELRNGGGAAPLGTIDARSSGFGVSDAAAGATQAGAGLLTGGNLGTIGYSSQSKAWGAAPAAARSDALTIKATNVGTVTVNPQRAHLSCAVRLTVQTDGLLTVNLAGCGRSETFDSGGRLVCATSAGFRSASARPRGRGVRVSFSRRVKKTVTVDVFAHSSGRRVLGNRRVARFTRRSRSFTWSGRGARVRDGVYSVRMSIPAASGRTDVRRVVLERVNGRFHKRPAAYRRTSCGTLSTFKLDLPVFGGTAKRSLAVSYRLGRAAKVGVTVLRGKRVVRRYRTVARRAGRTYRLRLAARQLQRGTYKVRITAGSERAVLSAERL